VRKTKKPKLKKEKSKIQEEKIAESLVPVIMKLNKKAEGDNTAKEPPAEQPLTPVVIDLIIQQKLSWYNIQALYEFI